MTKKPTTTKELFEFYYGCFKPLYSHVSALNAPPLEMFFEIGAALDHLSRHWKYDQSEQEAVNSACAHLKRGCFDAFKIILKETRAHYEELRKVDTSIIDNGAFDKKMISLFASIKATAIKARVSEGDSRDEDLWHSAFDLWEEVYDNCCKFDKEFYLNPKVEWARKRQVAAQRRQVWWNRLEGFIVSILAGLVLSLLAYCSPSCSQVNRSENVETTATRHQEVQSSNTALETGREKVP